MIEHALSCPKGGLVLARHDDAENEWGALGAWALIPSAIIYETKTNSRTVKGEMTWEGAQREGGTADGGTDIFGESQGGGGIVPTVNRASVLERGQDR